MNPNSKKAKRRRYRLHRKLKPFYKVEARRKTVHVPVDFKPVNKKVEGWIKELIEYGYNIQTTII